MTNGTRNGAREFERVLLLGESEHVVFRLFGLGLSARQIADELNPRNISKTHLSFKTVDTYLERVKNKLRLQTRREVLQLSIRYNASGLKRTPLYPHEARYKFLK